MVFSDPELQKQLLSGGMANIATLVLIILYKLISKKCDKTKKSDCTGPCGFSCHSVNRTLHNKEDVELGEGFSQENGESVPELHRSDD